MSGLLKFFGAAVAVLSFLGGGYYAVLGARAEFGGDILLISAVAAFFSGAAFSALFFGLAEVLERLPQQTTR